MACNIDITLNDDDHSTILAYKKSVERARGYHGPCAISVSRLEELHMPMAQLVVFYALQTRRALARKTL